MSRDSPLRACKLERGFTLIELIVVISIITILATVTFVSIDPGKRMHISRNTRRWSDVTTVLSAIKTYEVDVGSLPPGIDTASGSIQIIGEAVGMCASLTCGMKTVAQSSCGISTFDTDLSLYLAVIPMDPGVGTANDTRYYVDRDAFNRVTVGACDTEGEGPGGSGTPATIELTL